MGIPERIRAWRKHLGLTQPDFAKMAGLSKATLVGYEIGQRKPGAEALGALARTGVNMNWLLTGQGAMSDAERIAGIDREIDRAKQVSEVAQLLARKDHLADRWLRIFEMARDLPPEEASRYLDAMVDRLLNDLERHRMREELDAFKKAAATKD